MLHLLATWTTTKEGQGDYGQPYNLLTDDVGDKEITQDEQDYNLSKY